MSHPSLLFGWSYGLASVRLRRKVQTEVRAGGSGLRRVSQPPHPSDPARSVALSEVDSPISVLTWQRVMWQSELLRAMTMVDAAERHARFVRERYMEALERVGAPVAASGDMPPSKRARTALGVPGKGKGRAQSVVVEEVEDEEDELIESKIDELES